MIRIQQSYKFFNYISLPAGILIGNAYYHKAFPPSGIQHIVGKTVSLNVGKSRSFSFTDYYGDKVQCYINDVILIDVWKEAEEKFADPRYAENFSEEQIQEMKNRHYEMLEQNCPKGMCYIGVEYECSKDINLQFYSKEFLSSFPETHGASSTFLLMRLKSDKKQDPTACR